MNRLAKCINFLSKSMLKSTMSFIAIYFGIYLMLFLMLLRMVSSNPNSSGNMNAGFYFGAAIFSFVYVIASYKANFNYLIMFGNTRKNIFLSSSITFGILSVLLSAFSVIFIQLDYAIIKLIPSGSQIRNDFSILTALYKNNVNIATEFLWFLTLFAMICSFSMLYGALSYKFGKIFAIVFWVGFGLSWVFLPISLGLNGVSTFVNILKVYFSIGNSSGILLAPVNFILTTVFLSAITYAISRRQPQVA